MNFLKKPIFLLFFFLNIVTYLKGQDIVINEVMSKNYSFHQDEDGDFSDWIELYNTSSSPINLLNYGISDDEGDLGKWMFPDLILGSNEYLIVFASGKDRLDINELHTNFSISSDGEELILTNDQLEIIDEIDEIELFANESFGRFQDGENSFLKLDIPSPGSTNNNSNQLIFSHQEGFYSSPFELLIESPLGDTVFYTLNGELPTVSTNFFINSISINDQQTPNVFSEIPTTPAQELLSYKAWESPTEIIDKATILRCASFKNGLLSSKIYSKTFFVDTEMEGKYAYPIISLVTESNNLFDNETGIYVPGIHYDENNPEWSGNCFQQGENWEREVHISYFSVDGELGFAQDAGIRIHGGKTRQAAQKSLRLYAKNKYGKGNFDYQLFSQKDIDSFDRFLLRSTMGDWGGTLIKDVLAQEIAKDLNVDNQDYQPVIVYINGEYWGIQTIRDRIDESYIAYSKDIDKESVEIYSPGNLGYDSLINYITNNDLENHTNYEYVLTKIDIDNYIDYTIAELFFTNYDWPANNMKLWRQIPSGKWRWLLYDLDASFLPPDYNMLNHATRNNPEVFWPNSVSSTFLFRNLLKNDAFKMHFLSRYSEVLNQDFQKDIMFEKLESINAEYLEEIPSHITRWNFPVSINSWQTKVDTIISDFIDERPCLVRNNILNFFEINDFDFYCDADFSSSDGNFIIASNPNDGVFFIYNNSINYGDMSISIVNSAGQLVHKEWVTSFSRGQNVRFDLSKLEIGSYIVQLKAEGTFETLKMVIIR